jgi:hypothetical protein
MKKIERGPVFQKIPEAAGEAKILPRLLPRESPFA